MISAIIISFNDNAYLDTCLKHLSFVSQIIVIGTLDSKIEMDLKKEFDFDFIENKKDELSILFKIATKYCKHEWILGIEANMIIPNDLRNEIQSVVDNQKKMKIFKAKTQFEFMGKSMKFSGFRTKWISILWPKKLENIVPSQLNSRFITSYLDFDIFSQRTTEVAKRKAYRLHSRKIKPNMIDFILKPLWTLKKDCIFNLCLLDGKQGFILAYLRAFMQVKTYLFLWLNYRDLE
tara:strand:- start:4309 stop:5013 length:705 start_codon:yes stop_codon:yes gene_type:complete